MQKTTNYGLNQWDKTDRIQMEDFNADNMKIDAALEAVASSGAKIAVGSYTGNGKTTQTISLGFTPKAVYVCPVDGRTYYLSGNAYYYGGLAVTDHPCQLVYQTTVQNVVSVLENGFCVYRGTIDTIRQEACTNNDGASYHYFAIG